MPDKTEDTSIADRHLITVVFEVHKDTVALDLHEGLHRAIYEQGIGDDNFDWHAWLRDNVQDIVMFTRPHSD